MSWSLAHNLAVRQSAILHCYPTTTIYAVGDAAHLASHSDHNPDSRGIVHAIDVMMSAGTPHAVATLRWLLANHVDLQYVIHNHKIYQDSNGWKGAAYGGTDPHTNHIHVSGKHGSVGANSHTGTGYSVTAEQYTIKTTPCDKPTPPEDVVLQADIDKIVAAVVAKLLPEIKLAQAGSAFHNPQFDPDPVTKKYTKSLSGKLDNMEKKIDGLPKA